MPRNLDLTALRSFVAVADAGGVTRAASALNLTQSAVSMQVKRLEDALGLSLLDRAGRGVKLTAAGEQVASYARRMLDLNDEVYARLTDRAFEGEIRLGVPADIVYPHIPQLLQRFHAEYPRMKVQLTSSLTRVLKQKFADGGLDIILTTEDAPGTGAETLRMLPLLWFGAPGGSVWRDRPVRLAFEHVCIFRESVQAALDGAGIPWELAVESESFRTIEASVSADLAVTALLQGAAPAYLQPIPHGGDLPDLPSSQINLYIGPYARGPGVDHMADLLRQSYRDG